MNYKKEFERWLMNVDTETKKELSDITDAKEIEDRFYRHLEFGTGGLRGVIGAGTNRMNKYIVARATRGLAEYIKKQSSVHKSVVIAYDSRNFSKEFAHLASKTLNENGIDTYLFDELRPTPELSFAVRHLKATAGIVITASHNPSKYNGYKVYWSDGAQVSPNIANGILAEINRLDVFEETGTEIVGKQTIIGEETDRAYIAEIYKQSVNPDVCKDDFKLVYTPLHGSGNKLVRRILKQAGFENVLVVKEQENPDGNFPTVASPNPENKECFEYAIKLAKENNVDLIIGTDPDSDRMGIVVKNEVGEYVAMTGNQVGVMLLNYILSSKKPPENGAAISTIVSTRMAEEVTAYYNIKYFKTLTGFKFIGEKIHEFEVNNDYTFLLGFEESYGYLKGTYCRDKDAVVASMLTAEMAAYYAQKGLTLYEVMQSLYQKFGGFYEELVSITLEGADGQKRIKSIMKELRENAPETIAEVKVLQVIDYLEETDLPKADVLYFKLENDVHFVIRPSGTEPKVKLYYLAKGADYADAKNKTEAIKPIVQALIAY